MSRTISNNPFPLLFRPLEPIFSDLFYNLLQDVYLWCIFIRNSQTIFQPVLLGIVHVFDLTPPLPSLLSILNLRRSRRVRFSPGKPLTLTFVPVTFSFSRVVMLRSHSSGFSGFRLQDRNGSMVVPSILTYLY